MRIPPHDSIYGFIESRSLSMRSLRVVYGRLELGEAEEGEDDAGS